MNLSVPLLLFISLLFTPVRAQNDCITGTNSLGNNTAVVSSYQTVVNSIVADLQSINFKKYCTVGADSVVCQLNVQGWSTAFRRVCQEQGGMLVTRERVVLECSGVVQGTSVQDFPFDVFRIPLCVNDSCDLENLPFEINAMMNDVAEDFVTQVETSVSVTCNDATTSGANTMSVLVATVSGIAALSWWALIS